MRALELPLRSAIVCSLIVSAGCAARFARHPAATASAAGGASRSLEATAPADAGRASGGGSAAGAAPAAASANTIARPVAPPPVSQPTGSVLRTAAPTPARARAPRPAPERAAPGSAPVVEPSAEAAPRPAAPAAQAETEPSATLTLRIEPQTAELRVDETLTVEVVASAGAAVVDAPFHLGFDPLVLRFVDAAQGEFLSLDGGGVVFMANGSSRPGDVAVGLGRTNRTSGIAGAGVLARIRLAAIAPGSTALRLDRSLAWDAGGRRVEVGVQGAGVTVR